MDPDAYFVDIAHVYGLERADGRFTAIPRTCCLDEFAKRFESPDPRTPKMRVTKYQMCASKDVGSMTLEPPITHPMRVKDGLCYIQIYSSYKNIFDSEGHFPYPPDDDSGVCLALDHHTLDGLSSVVNRPKPDRGSCRKSIRASGEILATAMSTENGHHFPARLEIRMSRTLYDKTRAELERRRTQRHRQDSTERSTHDAPLSSPFYVHPTQTVSRFVLSSSVLTYGRLFQEIIGLAPDGKLGSDHQKLAVLVNMLQKNTYSCVDLKRLPILWRSTEYVEDHDRVQRIRKSGLGLKSSIDTYGFGYPGHDLIDWRELNFYSGEIADSFMRASDALTLFKAKPATRGRFKDVMQEIDQVIARLKNESDEEVRSALIHWLALRLIRQLMCDVMEQLLRSVKFNFISKEGHLTGDGGDEGSCLMTSILTSR